ncbi:hypothetical protein DL89DRAFT_253997 [Linderina pennispora]|uniref:Uncharacterized protein n=1 Tax=Linderina pennispora TaxID=61395 RepID=A0A1Y1WKL0_9FUNG|nr:uncharacterized protein DL89DRAFT_253997 [Linderina pennispora]ORX74111.1 hypothetical protein DL89DRAFT_253997 [Linderina pennispora]
MTLFSESAFTIVDFVAQRLIYVSWIPMVVAFITLCLSSDKERQFARLAKISRVLYLGVIALHLSYVILHPKAKWYSFMNPIFLVIQFFMIVSDPVFWLVYGDNAITVDVKKYRSCLMAIDELAKNELFPDFCVAFGTLGFGILYAVSLAIPIKDEVLTEDFNVYTSIAAFLVTLVAFGYVVHMKKEDAQKYTVKELSAEDGVAETMAEFANEEVPDQANKQV